MNAEFVSIPAEKPAEVSPELQSLINDHFYRAETDEDFARQESMANFGQELRSITNQLYKKGVLASRVEDYALFHAMAASTTDPENPPTKLDFRDGDLERYIRAETLEEQKREGEAILNKFRRLLSSEAHQE